MLRPAKQKKPPDPVKSKEAVQRSPDKRFDQDFEGCPHYPAKEETIKPESNTQTKTDGIHPKTKTSK
jgi:hypothetical protein